MVEEAALRQAVMRFRQRRAKARRGVAEEIPTRGREEGSRGKEGCLMGREGTGEAKAHDTFIVE